MLYLPLSTTRGQQAVRGRQHNKHTQHDQLYSAENLRINKPCHCKMVHHLSYTDL